MNQETLLQYESTREEETFPAPRLGDMPDRWTWLD